MSQAPTDWQERFGLSGGAVARFHEALSPLPQPERLAAEVARLLERCKDTGVPGKLFDDPHLPAALARFAYAAPFLLRHLSRHPRSLAEGVLSGLPESDHLLPWPGGNEGAQSQDEAVLMRQLRKWKYDNYARLTARDLLGFQDTATTCRRISDLADAMLRRAYAHAFTGLSLRRGLPLRGDGSLAGGTVLAMGKLGGRELNYSSDIDIIFVQDGDDTPCRPWPEANPALPGTSEGATESWWTAWEQLTGEVAAISASGGEAETETSSNEFHNLVARLVIRLLSSKQPEGIGFRVDCDLRPHGSAGFLATRLAVMEPYYLEHGREWERTAMIKARVVTGSQKVARHLGEIIRPFVYRRYLDYSALEGVAIVKHDIDRHNRASLENHLKLGRGGIRENEFLVQALQVLYGGKRPELQTPSHADSVHALTGAGVLTPEEGQAVLADYWLLRTVENRLQMIEEVQTHDLPVQQEELTRILHDFQPGFADRFPDALAGLEAGRARNEERFHALFAELGREAFPESEEWREQLAQRVNPGEVEGVLERVDRVFSRLMATRPGERCVFKLAKLLSRKEVYSAGTQPALPRWLEFIEQIGNRNAIFTLIESHPPIVPWISEIFREGGHHSQLLIRHPEFLETYFGLRESWDTLSQVFEDIVNDAPDEETFMLELQNAKGRWLIRVLTTFLHQPDAGHRRLLGDLADATVTACARFAWRLLRERLGTPQGAAGELDGFAVLALGKLGSRELRFNSDLDLIFVYHEDGETSAGRSHYEFFTKLTQKISTLLTSPTQFGRLYELDHRLRPFGNKGVLVPSLAAYRNFLAENAEVWNFQAFTRVRAVCGDAALSEALTGAIADSWRERRLPPAEIAARVWDMLERLVAEHAPSPGRGAVPLKYAVGGLLGYEFAQQAHFLRECAGGGNGWTPPPPHEIIRDWEEDYRSLGALDERLSFYESEGGHLLRPGHLEQYAALADRWNFEEVQALCTRMRQGIEGAFRDWSA